MQDIENLLVAVDRFTQAAKHFYFDVLFSSHPCPRCQGRIKLGADDHAVCAQCRYDLDPTVEFERSSCCGKPMAKKRCHYACTACGRIAPSRFLFEEKVFDAEYFRDHVDTCRKRKRRAEQELREMLLDSRAPNLILLEVPAITELPGLSETLDELICIRPRQDCVDGASTAEFRIEEYREHILSRIQGCIVHFDAFPPIASDVREDRARRFISLVFMEHDHEVRLTQHGQNVLVSQHETDTEG
ncbi:MAG: hypothetical protein HUU46_07585 [Candidatus Hydrogenedentes bacterium]|nr:hypothetical protein [Candidatus Hydrogenedentota bacterium]